MILAPLHYKVRRIRTGMSQEVHMRSKKAAEARQLSLFEPEPESFPEPDFHPEKPTVLEFVRARFENGPEMTPEEYRRWIRILIHHSLKRMD